MPGFRSPVVAVLLFALGSPLGAQGIPVEKNPIRPVDTTRIVRPPTVTPADTAKTTTGGVVTSGPKLGSPTSTTAWTVTAPGRYRVTLNGFTVLRQTYDMPLQLDGKGDEVYFATWVAVIDTASPKLTEHYVVQSREFGDRNSYGYRVRAGSASPLGGIRTGDRLPQPTPTQRGGPISADSLPMLLWEGELVPGRSAVVVTPTVWEWDHNPEMFGYWVLSRGAVLDRLMKPEAVIASLNNRSWFPLDLGSPGFVVHTNMFADNRDRPIGLELGKSTPQAAFVTPQPVGRPLGLELLGTIAENVLRFTERMKPLAQKYVPLVAKLMDNADRIAHMAVSFSRKTPLPYDPEDASLARAALDRFVQEGSAAGTLVRPKTLPGLANSLRNVVHDYTATDVYFFEKTLVLTPQAIADALQGASTAGGRPRGSIDVAYADHAPLQGRYILHLQVEKLP